jgi:DNA-binding NarL/FixJ family response regulator
MSRPRLLLADDHAMIVEALQLLLQDDFEIVGAVYDGRALLQAAQALTPDLLVLDIGMPLLNGLDAGEQVKKTQPKIRIIYLTQNRDAALAVEALRRHASGYVLKTSAAAELTEAIRDVLSGKQYLSPAIAAQIAERDLLHGRPRANAAELRPREREVLQLLAEGKSMKEAAGILHISPRTIEFHKYRMMETLGFSTTAELIQYALKRGLIVS